MTFMICYIDTSMIACDLHHAICVPCRQLTSLTVVDPEIWDDGDEPVDVVSYIARALTGLRSLHVSRDGEFGNWDVSVEGM